MQFGMGLQELTYLGRPVRRELVDDHVDIFASWLVDHDIGEDRDKLGRSVSLGGATKYLTGLGVECCVQRARAVTAVLKAMRLGTPRRERQDRADPVPEERSSHRRKRRPHAAAGSDTTR